MKSDEVKEILKKCFGKEKDTRYHAIAMLSIYAFIFMILIIFIRVGGSTSNNDLDDTDSEDNNEIDEYVKAEIRKKVIKPNLENMKWDDDNDKEEE